MDTSKIIKGVVNSGRYTVTAPIIKEDYGLYLQIEEVELPETYQVDFSNEEHRGTSVTMIGNADGVRIPRQFIDTGKDIFAFLYWVGEDYGKTVYKFKIPNKVRPDRTNEEPTPEEQSVIDQAISALNEAVEQTAQDVESAEQAKDDAESARNNAQTYANNAQSSAQASARSAESASESARVATEKATASAQSASQSAQIKADVEDLVDDAQSYAESALIASQASVTARDTAQGYANSASASAQSASTSASNASASAQTASTKATEASTSAQTASQKATESAQSASQALSYKTDAESAKTASQTAQGLAESARDSAISAKNDAESARDEAQQAVASISGALDEKAPVITDTASGAIASFSDGADDLPLKSLVVDINPVQDLHGQDSPYPAGGGKNKWDEEWESGGFNASGELLTDSNSIRAKNFCPCAENTDYCFVKPANTYFQYCFYDSSKTLLLRNAFRSSATIVVTSPAGSAYFKIAMGDATVPVTTYGNNIAVNYPSTVTTYAPYENLCPISGWTEIDVNHSDADMTNPTTLTINLGQTVYGGKLDVLSGELVIDRAMVDLGTLTWITPMDNRFYTTSLSSVIKKGTDGALWIQSSMFCATSALRVVYNSLDAIWLSAAGNISVSKIADTAAALKTAVTGQQLVYELAEPITIQLAPNQVNSLLGVNNIWADTGDTEVEYRADTKLFIERLTAPDSADMVADANITSGKYFMVGNTLYKATANIANGSAIVVGTNCTRKSLSEALNEINA